MSERRQAWKAGRQRGGQHMQCLLEPQCAPSLLPPTPCPPLRRYVAGAVTNWTLVSLNHDTQVGVGGWVGVGLYIV